LENTIDYKQGTNAWLKSRLGKMSASRIGDIIPGARGKYLASREAYMTELEVEITTGQMADFFENAAMRWGTETEPMARAYYEFEKDAVVEEVGFIVHPDIPYLGASPDGLIGEDGGLEIKCPNTSTLLTLRRTGKINPKHVVQCHIGMMCTGREWWDYFVFDPRLENNPYYYRRIERDEIMIENLTTEITKFWEELQERLNG